MKSRSCMAHVRLMRCLILLFPPLPLRQ